MSSNLRAKKALANRRQGIRAIAEAAHVSVSTVSRVINGKIVNSEMAIRVWGSIQRLGYVPNRQARSLVSGRSNIFGVLISEITNPFFPEIVRAFEGAASRFGYEIMVCSTNYNQKDMKSSVERLLQYHVDGVAVMTFGIDAQSLEMLSSRSVPTVFVDASPVKNNQSSLPIDYATGISEAVQHLTSLGHRKIAFISGDPKLKSAQAKLVAFRDAVAQLGLSLPDKYIVAGNHKLEQGTAAAQILLQLKDRPTAIMCSNDLTAIGALHALVSARIQVPQEMSLIGFDDIQFSEYLIPPLTTIRMSCNEIATAAARALSQMIADEPRQEIVPITTNLVIRGSTGVPFAAPNDLKWNMKAPRALRSRSLRP
jgi:LacI family transcriptional regulator